MSLLQLLDGSGNRFRAKINERLRLYVDAITQSETEAGTERGESYNINTKRITLTNDTETPVLYIKNNESRDLAITAVAVGISPGTGGDADIPDITMHLNPDSGTIISSGTTVSINSNRSSKSKNTLNVTALTGATGLTMSGGREHLFFFQTENGRLFGTIDEIIGPQDSCGFTLTPRTNNTSVDVYVAVICHLKDDKR